MQATTTILKISQQAPVKRMLTKREAKFTKLLAISIITKTVKNGKALRKVS